MTMPRLIAWLTARPEPIPRRGDAGVIPIIYVPEGYEPPDASLPR